MRHKLKLAIFIVVTIALLGSCVGIDADVRIGADSGVDLTLVYTVSSAVDELGKLGANAEYLPLPVGRADLELAASRAGGSLSSWSRSDAAESFTVKAQLRFPNPAAFASFMDPSGELAVFSESAGRKALALTLAQGNPPADPEFATFLQSAFGSYLVSLKFRLPKAAVSSSGLTVAGQTLSFSRGAAELYSSKAPVSIAFSW